MTKWTKRRINQQLANFKKTIPISGEINIRFEKFGTFESCHKSHLLCLALFGQCFQMRIFIKFLMRSDQSQLFDLPLRHPTKSHIRDEEKKKG